MEIWQVGRRKESKLAPPLRKMAATTCSRRQQPDGQAADTSLHTRHQMSLPPAKLFGDTGRLWGYWWRACRGHTMQTQTKPGFTGSAAHGTAWDVQGNGISEQNWGWKSLDSMASFFASQMAGACLRYTSTNSKSGEKEILVLPVLPQPHKYWALSVRKDYIP